MAWRQAEQNRARTKAEQEQKPKQEEKKEESYASQQPFHPPSQKQSQQQQSYARDLATTCDFGRGQSNSTNNSNNAPTSDWKYPNGGNQMECPFGGDRIYREFVKPGGNGKPENVGRAYAKCGSCLGENAKGYSVGGFVWLDEPHDGVLPCEGSDYHKVWMEKKHPGKGNRGGRGRGGNQQQVRILQRDPKDNKEAMVANSWSTVHDLLDSKLDALKARGLDWGQMKQFLDWNAPAITNHLLELLENQMQEHTEDGGENMGE